ncbi:MAG: hypothetical protein JKY93_03685 [Gammaproteobacteria bacterium]|nr:hypothetical protein [Gammaproteobacteria bacterium]
MNANERDRLACVAGLSMVPDQCGPAIVRIAPARGAVVARDDVVYHETSDGGFRVVSNGFDGRLGLRRGDAFDRMFDQAKKAKVAELFTPEQVSMGRFYRDLTERYVSSGMKCSSFEGVGGGATAAVDDRMDRIIMDAQELNRLHDKIGSGVAKAVRRVRPSDRGERFSIMDRRLVDMVCLEDQCVSGVLRMHGWAVKGVTVKAVRLALCLALDRMIGRRLVNDAQHCTFGDTATMGEWSCQKE